ncbi:hypothetical protein [Methanobacterium sp.]|uniref:hypothetical protein n=1 Tax=Methanobacterium sp. TaxID=2164 RepID=UPI003C71B5BF
MVGKSGPGLLRTGILKVQPMSTITPITIITMLKISETVFRLSLKVIELLKSV